MSLENTQFNYRYISALIQDEGGTKSLITILTTLFPTPKEDKITLISTEDIITFSEILQHYTKVEIWTIEIEDCIRAVFKALGNSMAFNKVGQDLIHEQRSILYDIYLLWDRLCTKESLLRICLKFLTNCVVRNKRSAALIWDKFEILIVNQLKHSICPEMAVYLYYNILLLQPTSLRIDIDILQILLALHEVQPFDVTTYCLQNLLLKQDMLFVFDSIQKNHTVLILRILLDVVNIESNYSLADNQLNFIADIFKKRWQYLISFYRNERRETSDSQVLEVIHLVNILALLTSNEYHLSVLQNDRNLFIDTLFLLKDIHQMGKQYQNVFTPINKLGDERSTSSQGLEDLLGFKSALVRIIGNLCNNHAPNQNEIREQDGIGLLLDCCNIDSKNPWIMQWAIFAIRNISKDNKENQKAISSMTMKSSITSNILKKMEFNE